MHEVYRIDFSKQTTSIFADRIAIDRATGVAVGSAFTNPDDLAATRAATSTSSKIATPLDDDVPALKASAGKTPTDRFQ
jgi:hypothetical protein